MAILSHSHSCFRSENYWAFLSACSAPAKAKQSYMQTHTHTLKEMPVRSPYAYSLHKLRKRGNFSKRPSIPNPRKIIEKQLLQPYKTCLVVQLEGHRSKMYIYVYGLA